MTDLIERAKAALRLLPVATHDTQDYCEATGPCFQAMTMDREAFEALNLLPDLLAEVEALTARAEKAEARVAAMEDLCAGAEGIFDNCLIASGACCCGENMSNHSQYSGHSPTDLGEHQAWLWVKAYTALKEGKADE